MPQVRPEGKCWGNLTRMLGWCEKKPRPGALTCSAHRNQELQAQHLKEKTDTLAKAKEKWGKDGHIEFSRTAPHGEQRKKLQKEVLALLDKPLADRSPEESKRLKVLRGMLLSYRCSVGYTTNVGLYLFHIQGQGDTWEEAFAKAGEK